MFPQVTTRFSLRGPMPDDSCCSATSTSDILQQKELNVLVPDQRRQQRGKLSERWEEQPYVVVVSWSDPEHPVYQSRPDGSAQSVSLSSVSPAKHRLDQTRGDEWSMLAITEAAAASGATMSNPVCQAAPRVFPKGSCHRGIVWEWGGREQNTSIRVVSHRVVYDLSLLATLGPRYCTSSALWCVLSVCLFVFAGLQLRSC